MSRRFPHRHLLGLTGLGAQDLELLLDRAAALYPFTDGDGDGGRHGGAPRKLDLLRGRTIINLFFENSTRTRTSFEIAAKRLSADAINVAASSSSTSKGETLIDSVRNLAAMAPDAIVIRHAFAGAAALVARHVDCSVINAGDGQHEHPTQGLLDLLTIRHHKGRIDGLEVAIVGDIAHSRVARSALIGLTTLGARVRLCAPWTLLPAGICDIAGEVSRARTTLHPQLATALEGADVVMMLRVQSERTAGEAPRFANTREFSRQWGLSARTLAWAKPDAIVMHPGPINRGVELAPDVADSGRSVILDQVSWGVAVRMAVFQLLLCHAEERDHGKHIGAYNQGAPQ